MTKLRPEDSKDYLGALGSGLRQNILAVEAGCTKIFGEITDTCKFLKITERSTVMLNYKESETDSCRDQLGHSIRIF